MSKPFTIENIQVALQCISSNVTQFEKTEALGYLEHFQKSTEAWKTCHEILGMNNGALVELGVFAAQTLRNKVTYDLNQLDGNLSQFKESLINFLILHTNKLIVTQLNVALARLAIQYLQWINPITEIINYLNPYPDKLLGFLKILPEETLDVNSTPLSEDEFNSRTHELVTTIGGDVLKFLVTCEELLKSNTAQNVITLEHILRCLSSWSFEFPLDELLSVQSLISLVFETLQNKNEDDPDAFDAAVDCLSVIIKESRDASNEQLILSLYEQLLTLQMKHLPNILTAASCDEYDDDLMESMTRIFVEAGEAWIVFISKSPQTYHQLVTILLMFTSKNSDLEIAAYTFPFWFDLKQNLVLPRYQDSKIQYTPIFIELIGCIITHLQYPLESFSSKEEEDKFKDFRYHMGDVLKDCTAVVGTTNALTQPLNRIKDAISTQKSWQHIEAPLFSLRTMASEVSLSEKVLLPEIFNILVTLPEQPQIRYAATLVLGRYTEWTAKHPELLELQLQYIFKGFEIANGSSDTLTASSHSLMYFCSDCSTLLSTYIDQLFEFYFNVQDSIDIISCFELSQGLSAVLNKQPNEVISSKFQILIDNNLGKLNKLVLSWQNDRSKYSNLVADQIDLLYAFFEELKPRYDYPQQGQEPLLPQLEYIWSALHHLLVDLGALDDTLIVERTTKLLRKLFENFHIFCGPFLSSVVEFLANGYRVTGLGSYLWCTGAIVVVYGDDESLPISPEIKEAVWQFAVSQNNTFIQNFKSIDKSTLDNYFESIMDFFSMISDLLMFYPEHFIMSEELLGNVTDVALESVTNLGNYDAYTFILRCLDDLISWGFKTPPISTIALEYVPDEWRKMIINELVIKRGSQITMSIFVGLVTNFNNNVHSDAISCLVKLFRIALETNNNDPIICITWLTQALAQFNNISVKEKDDLTNSVVKGLNARDYRKAREGIRGFINWYLRRNVDTRYD
ncbi:hypothetical protein TPHA_0E02080 [Tetrapisispora phaffii CBS 4417]|uniref:Importin N-terminal domain-containing protein n=1 Tax=Tetrapisispora phaffii (strain ATCC 24235 / CBS 4417 / NBRC 1672 / NRRL Y-8282 / UCD 70-5) TaxID=1071381 RepID=G8BTS2_TETPH|nr:hypothetical protein TPHA_0E02080 [Tetrapisispora phaffii CBS 4417]CCE63300.1 hypothetical protein TPHA_0E02080 [Tetrapisispora phaffii CBS 4417]